MGPRIVGKECESRMGQLATDILDTAIQTKASRENRLTTLLKDPLLDGCDGWYMYVPRCFNDALDIKLTERVVKGQKNRVWTQGSSFSFGVGDALYDTADAYKIWREALTSIDLCVQVKEATSVSVAEDRQLRMPGSVTFAVFTPNVRRTQIVQRRSLTMSQDDFVRFLIEGPRSARNLAIDP